MACKYDASLSVQLGMGSDSGKTTYHSPTQVGTGFVKLGPGYDTLCAIKSDKAVYCVGINSAGQVCSTLCMYGATTPAMVGWLARAF